jgi:2-oxo-4-hydroxy-4-carboxy-5-ureidoimidazoline decarboxylase
MIPNDKDAFVKRFGGVYEHSPWIAEDSWPACQMASDATQLATIMAHTLEGAPRIKKLALIRAHPDLAGKLAVTGELTDDSTSEQTSAGLDQCSEAEFQLFQSLNAAYLKKFEFPFVMAVRGSNRAQILQAFQVRIKNDYDTEFATAIREINKIAALRLEQIFNKV